jgi:hypothetical protein
MFSFFHRYVVVAKKCCGIETFFYTTRQPFMPQFRISESYYEKRCKYKSAIQVKKKQNFKIKYIKSS